MIIFKDVFTGDELFSDSFRYELVDDCVYKLKGKMRTESNEIDDSLIGGNASAEGGGEASEASSVSGIDVILNGRLLECQMNKKTYMTAIKEYMKRVKEHLEKSNPDQVSVFTSNIQKFVKSLLGEFKEYQFFTGESMNPDGMIILMKWDGETPYVYFFKHGLDEEKC